jgi:hypothetical protein
MRIIIRLGEELTHATEITLRARLRGVLVGRGKRTTLSVWAEDEDGNVLPSTLVEPTWVTITSATVRDVTPDAVVLPGWVEGRLCYQLVPPRSVESDASRYDRVNATIILTVDGEVTRTDFSGLRPKLEALDPTKASKVSTMRGGRGVSRVLQGPESVEAFMSEFVAWCGGAEPRLSSEDAYLAAKLQGVTKGMREAMLAPLQTKILEGYSTRFVDANREAIIKDGLDHEVERVTRWLGTAREPKDIKELRARLRSAEKALDYIKEHGLPSDVASHMPTCGPSVGRTWGGDD